MTQELEGVELDAAVCLAMTSEEWAELPTVNEAFHPSRRWAHGGPIIERERISLLCIREGHWSAVMDREGFECGPCLGPTPLIAAMRAFVASRGADL